MEGIPFKHMALVGFMGCGKSTIGARLAAELRRPFVDTDRLVEELTGSSIPAIFSAYGEPVFREHEHQALVQALAQPPSVLATGGGVVMREGNWQLLAEHAVSIWLQVPFAEIRRRLAGTSGRPLLQGDPEFEQAHRLFVQREPLYRRADIHVDATAPPARVVDSILEALRHVGKER